jgi:hypothetical protein
VVVQVVENNSTPPVENVTIPENATSVEEPVIVRVEPSQQQIDEAMEATRKRLGIVDTPEVVVKDVSLPSDMPEDYGGVTVDEEAVKRQAEEEAMEAAKNRVKNVGTETSEPAESVVIPPTTFEAIYDGIVNSDTYIRHESEIEEVASSLKSAGQAVISAVGAVAAAPCVAAYNVAKAAAYASKLAVGLASDCAFSAFALSQKVGDYFYDEKKDESPILNWIYSKVDPLHETYDRVEDDLNRFGEKATVVMNKIHEIDAAVTDAVVDTVKRSPEILKNGVDRLDAYLGTFSIFGDVPKNESKAVEENNKTVSTENETVVIPEDQANKSVDTLEDNVSVVIPEDPANKSVDVPIVNITPETETVPTPEPTVAPKYGRWTRQIDDIVYDGHVTHIATRLDKACRADDRLCSGTLASFRYHKKDCGAELYEKHPELLTVNNAIDICIAAEENVSWCVASNETTDKYMSGDFLHFDRKIKELGVNVDIWKD